MDNFVLLSEVFSLSLPRQIVIIKSNNQNMMKNLFLTFALLGSSAMLSAQATIKIPKVYQPVKKSMYHKGWIDFNKNGVMDVYENPNAKIEDRIEDLLGQMNIEEKTCQMVTLYGYKRVLKDALPTSEWKNMLWKDGIGAIDEHLNGFQQWGLPPSDNENVWPASRHAWALNERVIVLRISRRNSDWDILGIVI